MKLIKSNELAGNALNWAVAKAAEKLGQYYICPNENTGITEYTNVRYWNPIKNPTHAWPIMEREKIALMYHDNGLVSAIVFRGQPCSVQAPDALVAAMRCYVSHKLGDIVEVPEEMFLLTNKLR